jgi:hypothetical protein
MKMMFSDARAFNQPIVNWDVKKVKDFELIIVHTKIDHRQKFISKNNNLFSKIISEPRGVKSNYFGEDLEKLYKFKLPTSLCVSSNEFYTATFRI